MCIRDRVDEGQDLSTNPKSIKITLLADPTGIDATAITTPKVGESGDVTTNAPVGSLSFASGYSTVAPFQFSENTIVLPVLYLSLIHISILSFTFTTPAHC